MVVFVACCLLSLARELVRDFAGSDCHSKKVSQAKTKEERKKEE
jgi:hypothetical protein